MEEDEDISILKEIKRLSDSEPFQPFDIVMASGTRYSIGEADTVVIGRSVITVVERRRLHLLRQSQITELGVPEETA